VLRRLNASYAVKPVYVRHSTGYAKPTREIEAQEKIRAALQIVNPRWAKLLLPTEVWEYEMLCALPHFEALWRALDELAHSVKISAQYAALRFCRDVFHVHDGAPSIELAIVRFDELEQTLMYDGSDSPLRRFFKGFEFPVIAETKQELWESASIDEKQMLMLTFSCERSDGSKSGSCLDDKLPFEGQCLPCRRRLPVLHDKDVIERLRVQADEAKPEAVVSGRRALVDPTGHAGIIAAGLSTMKADDNSLKKMVAAPSFPR
jgi:hypothetical protein